MRSVRSRTAHAALVERDRDRTDGRRTVAVAIVSSSPWTSTPVDAVDAARTAAHAASASPSTRAMITSVPIDALQLGRACPRRRAGPWSMMPTRSASSSASSRYWVVRKIVMPSSALSRRTSLPHRGAADRVEPGRRLVEEQDLRVVDERRGQVEAAPHAARVGARCGGRARRRCRSAAELVEPSLGRRALGEAVQAALQAEQLACRSGFGSSAASCSATPMRRRTPPGRRRRRSRRRSPVRAVGSEQGAQHAAPWSTCRRRWARGSRRSRPSATSRSTPSTARVSSKNRRRSSVRTAVSATAPKPIDITAPPLPTSVGRSRRADLIARTRCDDAPTTPCRDFADRQRR